MNKAIGVIGVLALLAIAGFMLFFISQRRLADKDALVQEQMVELQQEQQRLVEFESGLRGRLAAQEQLARAADEARQMAEAAAARERAEREKLVADLNARLQREAEDRRLAEAAQTELAARMRGLEAAQAEAQAALAALERAGTVGDTEAMRLKLSEQQLQLASLSRENEALRQRQMELERQQIATEEAILTVGGRIELPIAEIRSPYARRKDALLFRSRVLGSGE